MVCKAAMAGHGTTFALHGMSVEGGLAAADAVITKLRAISGQRSRLPEPEYEAARAGLNIEYDEFAVCYSVQYRIRHGRERGYKPRTPEETQEAYQRMEWVVATTTRLLPAVAKTDRSSD
jgi:hypothetical protein